MKPYVRSKLIQIGNSRGVRLPKSVIQQCGMEDELEMTVQGDQLIIQAVRSARMNWDEQFQRIAIRGEDHPITEKLEDWDGRCREMPVRRFEVYQVVLASGQPPFPCLVVSPDEMNMRLGVVMVVPLLPGESPSAMRPTCQYDGRYYQTMMEQIYTVGKPNLVQRLGEASLDTQQRVLQVLEELFK
jgi:antitoxin MazE